MDIAMHRGSGLLDFIKLTVEALAQLRVLVAGQVHVNVTFRRGAGLTIASARALPPAARPAAVDRKSRREGTAAAVMLLLELAWVMDRSSFGLG
jgi:hypothetical protein